MCDNLRINFNGAPLTSIAFVVRAEQSNVWPTTNMHIFALKVERGGQGGTQIYFGFIVNDSFLNILFCVPAEVITFAKSARVYGGGR